MAKKSYWGKYKGIDVYQSGDVFYASVPRGVTSRLMKVNGSECNSMEKIKEYIDNNLKTLKYGREI